MADGEATREEDLLEHGRGGLVAVAQSFCWRVGALMRIRVYAGRGDLQTDVDIGGEMIAGLRQQSMLRRLRRRRLCGL